MGLREILLQYTGVGKELEEVGLKVDNFSGLYDLSLVLAFKTNKQKRHFFFSTYKFLRTLDDLVDLDEPQKALPILARSLEILEQSCVQPTGSEEVDCDLERFYSYQREMPHFERYKCEMAKIIRVFQDDAAGAIVGQLRNKTELVERTASFFFPAYQILLTILGKSDFQYSERFKELCFYHNSYAHITDYKKDLRSRTPQVPKEILERHNINKFETIQEDYPLLVRKEFIDSSFRGIRENIGAMFETNLPFLLKVGIFAYMLLRPIKYELKKYWNENYMRRD